MNRTLLLSALGFTFVLPLRAQAAATYYQDFNAYADGTMVLGDGSIIASSYGDTRVSGGGLQLTTDGYGSELANFTIPGLAGAANGWSASFKISISSEGTPADGFAFGWGGGLSASAEVMGYEDGWGAGTNHLYFSFDTLDNGGGEWGLLAGGADGTSELVFAHVPGALVGEGESVTGEVFIRWDPALGASFRTTGFRTNIDVTGIATPGLAAADSNAFAFAARTGALTSTMVLDDVRIESVPEPGAVSMLALALIAATGRRRIGVRRSLKRHGPE